VLVSRGVLHVHVRVRVCLRVLLVGRGAAFLLCGRLCADPVRVRPACSVPTHCVRCSQTNPDMPLHNATFACTAALVNNIPLGRDLLAMLGSLSGSTLPGGVDKLSCTLPQVGTVTRGGEGWFYSTPTHHSSNRGGAAGAAAGSSAPQVLWARPPPPPTLTPCPADTLVLSL
jgi:hypothetical protein